MRVLVRSPEMPFTLRLPIPMGLVGMAVSFIPERALAEARADLPSELQGLLTKAMLKSLLGQCAHLLKEYRGLEVIHVETHGGELISITL